MHGHQSDSDSSNDSMDKPPEMKATTSSKRHLEETDEMLADVKRLRDEFAELYEKDYPQLQRCLEKLHDIIRTFEEGFRSATKGTRDGGAVGIAGGATAMIAGITGLALAPFTLGTSLVVAGAVAGAGAATAVGGGIYGGISSSKKNQKMTQFRKDIEAELTDFKNKINPLSEKIKDINERIAQLLKDLDKLERDARDVSKYFASNSERRSIRREDMIGLTAQMTGVMRLIGTIEGIFSGTRLLLNLLSVIENTIALSDLDKLAKTPINEDIDEREMQSKAGKFIVGMRKVIRQLQDIMKEIKNTKDKMADFFNTTKQTKQ